MCFDSVYTRAITRAMTTPSTEWKEDIAPGEDERFEAIAKELASIAAERDGGTMKHRALHPKQHVGLRATLEVRGGLPPHAAQGLFAKPHRYHCYARFSNGAGRFQHDREPDLRGFAIKILDVDGKKALGDARTQDFLMVDTPKLPFKDVGEFVAFVRAGKNPKTLPQTLVRELGFFRTVGAVSRVLGIVKGKRGSLLDLTYYTVAPVAFGPHAARLSLAPLHDRDAAARAGTDVDYLGGETRARHGKHAVRFELRAQFFTSAAETPIERGDVEWPTPWVTLATLTLEPAPSDPKKREALDAFVSAASFDPWHALEAHKPLGMIMRARKHAYYASTQGRKAAAEPDGTEWAGFA
jgi:hypothetical protein